MNPALLPDALANDTARIGDAASPTA